MKGFFSKYKLDLLIILILLCLILFSLNNTLQNAFIGGTNDLEVHAYNLWYLKESLVNYHKIPLWTSDHFGGKPFLGIYQPLVYYLLLPVSLIFSPIHVPKISFILIEIVAAIGFYLLMIKLFKSKLKALLGSSIFILAPHKLLTIAGGSLVQIAAMAFLPWMFLLYEKIKEKQKLQYLALLGLLTGLLLLSHHAVGGCFIVAVLLLMLYDIYETKNYNLLKIIPFILLGILMSFVFLIPAYIIGNTLNFAVVKASKAGAFRILTYFRLFSRTGHRGEFLGIMAAIALIASLFSNKKHPAIRYAFVSLIFIIVGLHLTFSIPGFIKSTIEKAVRFFSILGLTLSVTMVFGFNEFSKRIVNLIKKYGILKFSEENKKKIIPVIFIILCLVTIISYTSFMPDRGNELKIPDGVVKFYKNISNDPEYFRVEDQTFTRFGFSPILHKHGILNGGNYLAASKYHFYFWDSAVNILNNEIGSENFVGLYGTLSIKYCLFDVPVRIPYLKEIEVGNNYAIYENVKFLDYVRLVPNMDVTSLEEPYDFEQILKFAIIKKIKFDKTAFVYSQELADRDHNLNNTSSGNVKIIEKEPGYLKIKLSDIDKKTYLVIAESYHPYWRAYQNEKELKIYRGIPSTLVIPVEDNGIVEVKYHPQKIRILLLFLSIIILLVLIIFMVYGFLTKKNG